VAGSLRRLNPFQTPDAQRLAILFAVVYFAQGMYYLPRQVITIVLKDRGLDAGQVADFFLITTIPWLIKPVYGLISDFVPLFGYRRRSYFLLTSGAAGLAALVLAVTGLIQSGPITPLTFTLPFVGTTSFTLVAGVGFFTTMALGLAFTDVLTDATMVEAGRPRGLTGAFQSVQWAAITGSAVAAGIVGGYLAGARNLALTFVLAAIFPLLTLLMTWTFVPESPTAAGGGAFRETWRAIRAALGERDVWAVAGFLFFYTFSPSFGPAFTYYQTDTLGFSQPFIGFLDSVTSVGQVVGAVLYAPLSRRVRLRWLIVGSIGLAVIGTLAYLFYRGPTSALVISAAFGVSGMLTVLAFLDLAAKACPRRVEATFFALLMSVYNAGAQVSENVGARLYTSFVADAGPIGGYTRLIWISAIMTALAWAIVPLVGIDRIEAKARADAADGAREVAAAS
jgi:MFS family permease